MRRQTLSYISSNTILSIAKEQKFYGAIVKAFVLLSMLFVLLLKGISSDGSSISRWQVFLKKRPGKFHDDAEFTRPVF